MIYFYIRTFVFIDSIHTKASHIHRVSFPTCTKGPDEVIEKFPIWLKLYQMNTCNLSRKDQESYFQNMN